MKRDLLVQSYYLIALRILIILLASISIEGAAVNLNPVQTAAQNPAQNSAENSVQSSPTSPQPVLNAGEEKAKITEPPEATSSANIKIVGQMPEKAKVCVACHGLDGNSTVPTWPKIAGQPIKYLIEQLTEYRKGPTGNRYEPNMFGMTHTLSDQDIADLAAFFATQKATMGSATPDNIALGEKLYRGGNPQTGVPACSACHSPEGKGNIPAGFPPLGGQYAAYTIDQLKKFRAGTRKNDPNGIMRDIAKKMTDQEMEAVSNYVSGLH